MLGKKFSWRFAVNKRILSVITAVALGLGLGWGLATQVAKAQAPPAHGWKGKDGGKEEFDIAAVYQNGKDCKAKIAGLDAWKKAFPDSEWVNEREDWLLAEYQACMMTR